MIRKLNRISGTHTETFKPHIRWGEDTVIKTGPPDCVRLEVEKTIRAYRIGQDCDLFQVPQVLDYDDSRGKIVLQRLHNIQPVRDVLAFGCAGDRLAQTIGASLAIIHRELKLPADMVIPLPSEFSTLGNDVFLHGDYTVDNVFVNQVGPPIAILDWQMTRVHGGTSTHGTRYFDLAWFINTLFYRPLHRYLLSKPAAPAARRFVESYSEVAGSAYDADESASYMMHFLTVKLGMRRMNLSWRERLLIAPSHARWRVFVESLRT